MRRLTAPELENRASAALSILRSCRLCPRACGVNRTAGERGFCGAGMHARVAAAAVHHGEEPPLSGTAGSGNIFFSGCNLACVFCQNYPISRLGVGRDLTAEQLAGTMMGLQGRGVHNVNLVTPTPWVPQILSALAISRDRGFSLPLVYNTGGYDSVEALRLLEGTVDIYLPDMKYADDSRAKGLSRAWSYRTSNRRAVAEMNRQVGPLATDDRGVACRGVLVRHLVLPGGGGDTADVIQYLKAHFPALPLSIMFQYFPAYRAVGDSLLGRRLLRHECVDVEGILETMRIELGWKQCHGEDLSSAS